MSLTIQPQWIARMYPGKKGMDHLGLGSVSSDQILQALSPGINVLTLHPRYYSFYTFLLDEFWRRDRPRSRHEFELFFRPREFIFSVGAQLCKRAEHGVMRNIIGSRKTAPLAAEQRRSYDTTTDYIISDLGGYGLYYRSVMMEVGLIYPGGPGFPYPFDVPTEKGKEVADSFRQAIQQTSYYREYFDHDSAHVPIAVIKDYIQQACLCQIQKPEAPDRPLLQDIFLHGGPAQKAASRRATLRFFLDIAAQTHGYAINEDAFRQLLYFQETADGARYLPQETVQETFHCWRLYQAREYYAFALNAMWSYICTWGLDHNSDRHPLPLSQFWQHIDTVLTFEAFAARWKLSSPGLTPDSTFEDLLNWLRQLVNADEHSFDHACTQGSPIQEHRLSQVWTQGLNAPEVMIAGMMVMLGLIYLRFGQPAYWLRPEWAISRMGANGRLSLDSFVKTLRRLQQDHVTIREVTRWIYNEYVILQHQLVANSKLPENTFRFRREGDRLRFYQLENRLTFSDSRFDALSTTIHELGWCGDLSGADHTLSAEGQKLLREGDL
ncbi:MAG TPA: hypothetical protein VKR06_12015 [Ktedonosporobacter sp.]|nr:hypothetical protein [Ktedonosporobacter sp.]